MIEQPHLKFGSENGSTAASMVSIETFDSRTNPARYGEYVEFNCGIDISIFTPASTARNAASSGLRANP
jgi:hypothetical protein